MPPNMGRPHRVDATQLRAAPCRYCVTHVQVLDTAAQRALQCNG
jgi:hypothetical protein